MPGAPTTLRRSPGEPALHEHPQRDCAVAPCEGLALVPLASHVADRYLVDVLAPAQHARGDLGLEVEPVGGEGQRVEEVTVEDLVAGLDVGEGRVVEHV